MDLSGKPVAQFPVQLEPVDAPQQKGAQGAVAFTDSEGRFRFYGLPPGLYRLRAMSQGKETSQTLRIEGRKREEPVTLVLDLPPRVYLHIRVEQQRDRARELAKHLETQGFVVPGIERVEAGPTTAELRYYFPGDAQEANEVVALLQAAGLTVSPRHLSGREQVPGVRPRLYELWLDPGVR